MMPASASYRIPRAEPASRNVEAERFVRSEYPSTSLAWMLRARPQTPGLGTRLAAGILAAFGSVRGREARTPAQAGPLRTGVAAVHFIGEPDHAHPRMSRPHPHSSWDAHAAGSFHPPALAADLKHEPCECHP